MYPGVSTTTPSAAVMSMSMRRVYFVGMIAPPLVGMATGSTKTRMWIYRQDLFESETIRQISKNFQSLLDAVFADPTCVISDVVSPNLNKFTL